MLIGCITGPDFETAKRQIEMANILCDGVELRTDFIHDDVNRLIKYVQGELFITDASLQIEHNNFTISTYHNFEETPDSLEKVLKDMPQADIYKIATMANSMTDSLRMIVFSKKYQNVAGMCMGPFGEITRILGPVIENPLTFASIGKQTAPGQMEAKDLIDLYNFKTLNSQTVLYGLIGNPLSQSPSHKTHNSYFRENDLNAVYVKMPLNEWEIPQFFDLIKQVGFKGLSVTIPLKEKLFPFIDEIEEDAQGIGAINTLTFEDRVYGTNTDGKGALDAIEKHTTVRGKYCVVIGAGGSAKAIIYEARKRGATVTVLSRRFKNLDKVPPYDILINTTPNPEPISLDSLQAGKIVMDISISHANSTFMKRAKEIGCKLIYGIEMFEKQALFQFERWGLSPTYLGSLI